MDPAPRGPSNPADVASVGQQQTLPGGTNAEKRTGTAQHVRLLSPRTHTRLKTHTHNHFSICTICQDSAELHSTLGWSWQPTEQPLIFNDSIFYAWFRTRPLSRNYAFLRKDYIYRQYGYMDMGESQVHQCAMQQSG